MSVLTNSHKSKQIYEYLFNKEKFLNNYEHYYFWIIDIEKSNDVDKILGFFEEMLMDVAFLKHDDIYVMFYFSNLDFEVKNMINSVVDDFSIKLKIYASSKIDSRDTGNYFTLCNLYNKYLKSKSKFYMTNTDLVSEIIRLNIKDIKLIKPIIFKNILDDPQIEALIQAMFSTNLNVTQTASKIYMHRNTVIKKLEYIKNETGLNIQRFLDANIMYWLVRVK